MTKAVTLLLAAGLTAAAFAGHAAVVQHAEETAARETLSRLVYQSRLYSYQKDTTPVAVLPELVAIATTADGQPVPGLSLDGATMRYHTDDNCWKVTVTDDADFVPPVVECKEVAS